MADAQLDPRMRAILRDLFPTTPDRIAQAMLRHLLRTTTVTSLRVHLTHANVHRIFRGMTPRSQRIRAQWPLELRMAKLGEPPETIDCRQFTVPWDIAIPPAKPSAPVNYPKDTGDPVKDFHPPHVEPLTVLDEVQPHDGSATESRR